MSTPINEAIRQSENERLGAALAAIANRSAPHTTPDCAMDAPVQTPARIAEGTTKATFAQHSPWTRRKRPLYNF